MAMPHKEERFIMPIIPAVCLISGFFIHTFKKYKKIIFGSICVILVISLCNTFKIEYEDLHLGSNLCFSDGNNFLASDSIDRNSLIVTNQLPIVHFYTQKEVHLYPEPWNLNALRNVVDLNYKNGGVYIYFSNYGMTDSKIKSDLSNNFKKVFECSKGNGYSAIYEYK